MYFLANPAHCVSTALWVVTKHFTYIFFVNTPRGMHGVDFVRTLRIKFGSQYHCLNDTVDVMWR